MYVGPDRSQRGWSTSGFTPSPRGSWWRLVAAHWGPREECCGCLRLVSTAAPSITYPQATLCARSEMIRALCFGAASVRLAIRLGLLRLGQDEVLPRSP